MNDLTVKICRLIEQMDAEGQKKCFGLVFRKYNEMKNKAAREEEGILQPSLTNNTSIKETHHG